ncbi:hypothetical protein FB475_6329 [Kribbella jejuensis]|uniref:Uncharacterized protein n=2 Tax=Kribbella jejuensis TaxID=236068 RepID=A0A542DU91_9ACTN|nr:hypothetical protein FB475_6329 [Kribbella jejuensis]
MENPYAGQGPVLLDIGGDIGALVVAMPAELEGKEVEIRPVDHRPDDGPLRHVAVLGRTFTGRTLHSAVFPDLPAGRYALSLRPDGEERLRASVTGGQVCYSAWPGAVDSTDPPAHSSFGRTE